jgi:hypothetical protein
MQQTSELLRATAESSTLISALQQTGECLQEAAMQSTFELTAGDETFLIPDETDDVTALWDETQPASWFKREGNLPQARADLANVMNAEQPLPFSDEADTTDDVDVHDHIRPTSSSTFNRSPQQDGPPAPPAAAEEPALFPALEKAPPDGIPEALTVAWEEVAPGPYKPPTPEVRRWRFKVDDFVEYYSYTKVKWIPARVLSANDDGTYNLTRMPQVPESLMREAPGVWAPAKVTAVNADGTVALELMPRLNSPARGACADWVQTSALLEDLGGLAISDCGADVKKKLVVNTVVPCVPWPRTHSPLDRMQHPPAKVAFDAIPESWLRNENLVKVSLSKVRKLDPCPAPSPAKAGSGGKTGLMLTTYHIGDLVEFFWSPQDEQARVSQASRDIRYKNRQPGEKKNVVLPKLKLGKSKSTSKVIPDHTESPQSPPSKRYLTKSVLDAYPIQSPKMKRDISGVKSLPSIGAGSQPSGPPLMYSNCPLCGLASSGRQQHASGCAYRINPWIAL